MIEVNTAFSMIIKGLSAVNETNGFAVVREHGLPAGELPLSKEENQDVLTFAGPKGSYKIKYDSESDKLTLHLAEEDEESYKQVSVWLFDKEDAEERDVKSIVNDFEDTLKSRYTKAAKKLDGVKMPRAVSKSAAKKGSLSYDPESLATRFAALYPEYKDVVKQNIVDYGEFLPEDFAMNHIAPKVMEVMRSGNEVMIQKVFKLLNEIYEDGTNQVQDIIAVTILGEMKNDPKLMEIAARHMSDYLAPAVQHVNRILCKENKYTKGLKNPPPYKPKKKKKSYMSQLMNQQPPQ